MYAWQRQTAQPATCPASLIMSCHVFRRQRHTCMYTTCVLCCSVRGSVYDICQVMNHQALQNIIYHIYFSFPGFLFLSSFPVSFPMPKQTCMLVSNSISLARASILCCLCLLDLDLLTRFQPGHAGVMRHIFASFLSTCQDGSKYFLFDIHPCLDARFSFRVLRGGRKLT